MTGGGSEPTGTASARTGSATYFVAAWS
jgi:hypothetical protein